MKKMCGIVKRLKTIIANPKFDYVQFEVVTGMTREYLRSIMCENEVEKMDSCRVIDFFKQNKDQLMFEKECLRYEDRMRDCYAYLSKKITNYRLFSEYECDRDVRRDPGLDEVIPIMSYFGKFMFDEDKIRFYELTNLEKMVVGQILLASPKMLKEMYLHDAEVNVLRQLFEMQVPALFVRRLNTDLPAMVIDTIINKIARAEQARLVERAEHSEALIEVNLQIVPEDVREVYVVCIDIPEVLEIIVESSVDTEPFYLEIEEEQDKDTPVPDRRENDENEILGCEVRIREGKRDILISRERTSRDFILYGNRDSKEIKSMKDFYSLNFEIIYYDGMWPEELIRDMAQDIELVGRVVLSRVSKLWYMAMKGVKFKGNSRVVTYPKCAKKRDFERIIDALADASDRFFESPFVTYVMTVTQSCVYDISDYAAFLERYSKRITPGVVLLLSILYVKMSKRRVSYRVGLQILITLYDSLSDYVKWKIKKNLDDGRGEYMLFDYRGRGRSRRVVRFREFELGPKRCCDKQVWNGLKVVHVRDRDSDILEFSTGIDLFEEYEHYQTQCNQLNALIHQPSHYGDD